MGKKIIFISDVHLGAGRFSNESQNNEQYKFEWDRLSEKETRNFEEFLKYLGSQYLQHIEEIVLLGDIFDNWVFPHDLAPPTMDELLSAKKNKNVVKELNLLSEEVPVFFVPGNHDMHATKVVMKDHFPKIKYCPEQYLNNRLIAEHGHRYAMFNAPARFSGNYLGLPLGYFISRIEASRKAMTGRDDRTYHTYIDDFIEMAGNQTLPQCVLEAVIEEADLDEDIQFKIKRENGKEQTISAKDVKERYKNIYNDWPATIISKHRAILAELDRLGPIADKLCKNGKNRVCIFGHSHKSEIDKDTFFVEDRLYANAGYWCGKKCTFVEVEKTSENYDVCIVKWKRKAKLKKGKVYSI